MEDAPLERSMRARSKTYACGVQAAWTEEHSPGQAASSIAAALDRSDIGQLLVFFSPSLPAAALSRALSDEFGGIPVAGCSTAGQISPEGFSEAGLLAVAFPKQGFRVVSKVLQDLQGLTVERGAEAVRELRAQLDHSSKMLACNRFALSFIDGLSNCEEMLVSVLGWALGNIPLVGGSAGDNLALSQTSLLHNGQIHHNAALLLIVETGYAVRTFSHDNFEPTEKKLVVTASKSEMRTVHEFNAERAASEYASLVGVDHKGLTPMSFAAHPVVVRIGGDYYCRSIRKVNGDGSLSFFCAIDNGVVLTVARARDLISAAEKELTELDAEVGGLDLVLGFECVLRRLDSQTQQIMHHVHELYRRHNIIGFHTYGEQFNSMHLNQTLTGVAIGARNLTHVR
ncbi:MAG: FIST N-terminal domain-containing protein [Rhodomicrobium sp.]